MAICTVAALLSACVPNTEGAPGDLLQGDLDALVGAGAVGAIATRTDHDATTVASSGLADIAAGTPLSTDHPQYVRVGSVTKSFTAAIALQLVSEHRLELDRPVGAYLPGLLTGQGIDGDVITVRQVLGQRSGLPEPAPSSETGEVTAASKGRIYTPAEEIDLALRHPASFAPGDRFEYSNTNYIVAGMMIEAVTGHRFSDELRDRILIPLGLSHTYLPTAGDTDVRDPHPTGYALVDGVATDRTRTEPSLPWTSGALISTGADLNHFYTALLAGRVVPPPLLPQMLDGSDMGNGMSYGLGVGYTELPCGAQYVGHVGGVPGFSTISGATAHGRSVTISYTGTPETVDIRGVLTRALCG